MIVAGAPLQFDAFVSATLHVDQAHQAMYLGFITPVFMVTFSFCSIGIGHLVHHHPPFRLLSIGMCVWCFALVCSGLAYWMPHQPATYWAFLAFRSISGVGEAAFQCIVPAYVEDFAPPGKRALWLAILYASIPTGSAVGFGYGALLAPSPPHSLGWGWAYLIEAAIMLPCAICMAWLPTAAAIRRRRAAAAAMDAPLIPPQDAADATSSNGGSAEINSGSDMPAVTTIPVETDPSTLHRPSGRATSASDAVAASATPSVQSQLAYLLCSPTYMLIALGYAAFTATVMGISQFAPLALLALGFYEHQFSASTIFGAVSAFAGVLGTPVGGYITDMATSMAMRKTANASGASDGTGGDSGGDGGDGRPWVATLREARALLGAITVMIALAAILCVGAVVSLQAGPDYAGVFLTILCLAVTFSFATSAGISRAVMLTVPVHVRPFALGLLSLLLHGLGDVPSPPILGALIGAWAPACASVVYVNQTTGAVVPSGGEPAISPECAADKAAGQIYSVQQQGMISALLLAALYMLTATGYWSGCYMVLTRRMRTETACPQPKSAGELVFDRGSVNGSMNGSLRDSNGSVTPVHG